MLCRLLSVALAACALLPAVSAFSGYRVSQQSGPGQLPSTYQSMSVKTYPIGPFPNKSSVQSEWDVTNGLYASWWQYTISPLPSTVGAQTVPFVFPFFGVNYTALTVTSKGFVYLQQAPASPSLDLSSAQYAPDYATGLNLIQMPVISILHSMGGAVGVSALIGGGPRAAVTTPACQAGTGPCVLQNYYYSVMPPIVTFASKDPSTGATTLKQLTPTNSLGTTADGYRFVLSGLQMRDVSGVAMSVVLVLYQSGLIEAFFYSITPAGSPTDSYTLSQPVSGHDAGFGVALVGISDGHTTYTLADTISQKSYAELQSTLVNNNQGSAISFVPY